MFQIETGTRLLLFKAVGAIALAELHFQPLNTGLAAYFIRLRYS
jgi:hypothetical protein